ncbi:TPA: hypothetical protein ACGO1T_000875 [Streptococcus suis]
MIDIVLGLSIIIVAGVCFAMQVKVDKLQKHIYWIEAKVTNATYKLEKLENKTSDD